MAEVEPQFASDYDDRATAAGAIAFKSRWRPFPHYWP